MSSIEVDLDSPLGEEDIQASKHPALGLLRKTLDLKKWTASSEHGPFLAQISGSSSVLTCTCKINKPSNQ